MTAAIGTQHHFVAAGEERVRVLGSPAAVGSATRLTAEDPVAVLLRGTPVDLGVAQARAHRRCQEAMFGRGRAHALTLGRYQLGGPLAAGGFGTVYAAYDPELRRDVAIKVLECPPERCADRMSEARTLARLTHPHVVPVFDVGELRLGEATGLFIVMPRVEHGSLEDWLAAVSRSDDEIIAAFIQAGRGLAAVHDQGLVHRDFKPANVVMGRGGQVAVADFGLAVESGRTVRGGTPAFVAPEETVDGRSDQYSFAVALREALAERGRRELAEVLGRATAGDPDDRFASMAQLLRAIDRARARGRRRIASRVATGVGVSVAGLVLASGLWARDRQPLPREIAKAAAGTARVQALIDRGEAELSQGVSKAARVSVERAAEEAAGARLDALEAEAAVLLVSITGYHLGDRLASQRWARLARSRLDRLRDEPELAEALFIHQANVAYAAGDVAQAEEHLRAAIDLRELAWGEDHERLIAPLNNLGVVLTERGALTDAERVLDQAVSLAKTHRLEREIGGSLVNLGLVHAEAKDFERAERTLKDALVQLGETDHPYVGAALVALSSVHLEQGAPGQARDRAGQAQQLWTRVHGAEDHRVARAQLLWAEAELQVGDRSQAIDAARRAVAGLERKLGAEHPTTQNGQAFLDSLREGAGG